MKLKFRGQLEDRYFCDNQFVTTACTVDYITGLSRTLNSDHQTSNGPPWAYVICRSWAANGMTVKDKHYAILCITIYTRRHCTNTGLLHWSGTSILSSYATTTHRNTSSMLNVPDQVRDSHNTLWNCAAVAMVLLGNLQELNIWLDYQTRTNVGGEGEFEGAPDRLHRTKKNVWPCPTHPALKQAF